MTNTERIQKILAAAGYGSRRACEALISAGRVQIDGRNALLGEKVDPTTVKITVDLETLRSAEVKQYIMLYKPRGVVSSLDPQGDRQTVRDLVPEAGRLYPVGRLDLDSEGLLLLTNDGELTQRLSHPRYQHEREYEVLVDGYPDFEQISIWRRGVVLPDGFRTSPAQVTFIRKGASGTWLRVIMHEGHKRQIREIGKTLNLNVKRLIRVRFGMLHIGSLEPGQWRYLNVGEIHNLQREGVLPRGKPIRKPFTRPTVHEGDRPRFDRPAGERSSGSRPPQGGNRPHFDRPAGERPSGSRPPQGGNRPHFDRPAGERPSGSRPPQGGNRPHFDRPAGERPSGSRPPQNRSKTPYHR